MRRIAKKRCGTEMENRSSVMNLSGTSSIVVSVARVGSGARITAAVDCKRRRRLLSVFVEGVRAVPKP